MTGSLCPLSLFSLSHVLLVFLPLSFAHACARIFYLWHTTSQQHNFALRRQVPRIQITWRTLQYHFPQRFYAKESHNRIMWRHNFCFEAIPQTRSTWCFYKSRSTWCFYTIHCTNLFLQQNPPSFYLQDIITQRDSTKGFFVTRLHKCFCHDNTQLFRWLHFQMANVWVGKQC